MLAGLAEAADGEHEIVAFTPVSVRARARLEESLDGIQVERRIISLPPSAHVWRTVWSRSGLLPVERVAGPLDVFHFSDWMYPRQRGGLRTTTIYDLIPLRFPDWVHPRTRRMNWQKYKHSAKTCDLIIAISDFTANDVAERLGYPRERITVARPGVDERFRPEGPRRGGDYILMLAPEEPRKNYATLANAFELVRAAHPDLELLAPNNVPHDELPTLYRGAAAFAYPSYFEGFGIPILEAMASGTPVLASSHPSLDEACGDAAVRASPDSPEELAAGIELALKERASLAARGLEHARRFTWQASGKAYLHGFSTAL